MSHPPHLTSSWSSAFIPFCAYKTDLSFTKNMIELLGITFPLCSSFLPTLLEGQLCYKLTLKEETSHGKRDSLVFLLDYNEALSLQTSFPEKDTLAIPSKKFIFNKVESSQLATFQINTLSAYRGFREGVFTMTNVKRITAKEDFLKMPLKDRKCNVELREDCRTRKLLEECNCVPWDLPEFQVRTYEPISANQALFRKCKSVICKAGIALQTSPLLPLIVCQAVMGYMQTCPDGGTGIAKA